MCLLSLMKFPRCLFKILKKDQRPNVADRKTDGWTYGQRERVYTPPHTHTQTEFAGGGITRSPKQDVDFHSLIGEREMKAQRKVSTLTTAL